MEQDLRTQLEAALGRELSEDEWQAVAGGGHNTPEPARSRARSVAEGTLSTVGFVLGTLLAGAVAYGLLLGLLWAYNPGALEDENLSVSGLVVGAWFVGFVAVGSVVNWPRAAPILLGVGFVGGLVALAIGALIRAGG
jgi:hypothetical protein